jgi:hypothetical protein
MKSHVSFTGLSIAVLMFVCTVAMHEAARGEGMFDPGLAPGASSALSAPLSPRLQAGIALHHGCGKC